MNVHLLARRMRDLLRWLEAQEQDVAERVTFDAAPYGRAYLTLDPGSIAPAASFNHNRIQLCGAEGGLTEAGLRELVERFTHRGIPRMFVWLSPGPGIERVRNWVAALRFERVPWTRYPTLLLGEPVAPARPCSFEIREIGVAAFSAAKTALGERLFESFARTLEKPGFHHYLAYDGTRPSAAAALVRFGEIGYLTWAHTVESDRRRGAQSALIGHRIEAARGLGCERIVSQTLTLREDSLANLEHCGIREVYEQEVYELVVTKPHVDLMRA